MKRRNTKENKLRSRAARKGRLFFVGTTLCILSMWFGINTAHPFQLTAELRRKNEITEKSLGDLTAQNENLQTKIRALNTPEGIELTGRKHGFAYPNEHRLIFP